MQGWFWKIGLMAISMILSATIFGCGDSLSGDVQSDQTENKAKASGQNNQGGAEKIIEICMGFYETSGSENNNTTDLELLRRIVNELGENGYPAVDSKNQIDMTQAEQVMTFCEKVDAQEEAEITIIEVDYFGGFVKYDLYTKYGNVDVVRSYYAYKNGMIQGNFTGSYQAENWNYTEEGYLMFSGVYFSEEQYALTLSGVEEYTALRVEPLDEACRELTRKYFLPIGFERNNMFLVDWSEDDFGELNFYDMYDILYRNINRAYVPYGADDNLGVRAVYQIPKEEFENVIMTYFNIESETLQSKTIYDQENATYKYEPRGFEEVEYPEYPYSEVVGFTKNGDGTITLTANVVFPYAGNSKVYTHEVVVRPLEDGEVQYVSNKIIPSEDNQEETWHTPRLATEGREETDAETSTESAYWFVPQASDSLISDDEKRQLQSMVLSAAESVSEIYRDIVITDTPGYSSGISKFTREQRRSVVEKLGKSGLVSVEEDSDMQNHEALEAFYSDYLSNQDSMVTIFEVQRDGLIGAVTFIYRKGKLQTYYIGIRWKKGGIPEMQGTSVSSVDEIKLTEKGYFIYAYETVTEHSSLRQYWRTKLLSEECRELTRKYISGLSYVNYNVLVTNWNSSNVEDILMPCMYEDIYRIHTGENLKTENREIPAEQYEQIMTTYFPVSVEQLREYCRYDADNNCYEHEMIYASQYPPFGEVVDYMENADGTLTLIVDGVWPDYNSDLAFRNEIVVQPFEDGTFRYLSNSIEQIELELPLIASSQ